MTNTSRREPFRNVAPHAAPWQLVTLAATAQYRPPQIAHCSAKSTQRRAVHGHSVITKVPQQHRTQVRSLFPNGRVHASPQLFFQSSQFSLPPQAHRLSQYREVLWWVDFFRLPVGFGQEGDVVRVTMVPVWHNFFWAILAVIVASMFLAAVNFVRLWWTRTRATVRLAIDAAALVISLLLLRTGYYANVSGAGLSTTKAAEASHAMNMGLQIMVAVITVAFALGVVFDLRRMLRKPSAQLAHQRA